jgi:hypothetical protein
MEQTVDKQRVNRVTVQLSGDGAAITLYRTNTRLGEVRNGDVGVPDFSKSGLPNKQVYVNYCRETMTNLLKNDGVPGFYYDSENHATNNELPRKFNKDLLVRHGYAILDDILSAIHVPNVSHTIIENDDIPCVTIEESYSDGFIKYGQTEFKVRFDHTSGANKQVVVPVSIKSGQLTKPKIMTIDGQQKNINSVNIMNLFQDQKPAATDKPIQSVVIAKPADSGLNVDMPKAPGNQEFEGYKPVSDDKRHIDPDSDAAAEQAINGASEQSATSESGTAIQDAINKMGTGKLTGEDIQKLREMVGGGKIDGTVGSIMNVLRGDKK